jgi:hypothetical protein
MDECMRSIWVYMYKKKKREKIKAEREKEEIYTYSYRVYPRVSHACLIGRLIYRCSFGYWLLRLKGRQKSPFSLFWCCWRDGEPFILQLSTFFCFVLFFKIGFSKVNAERRRRILFFLFWLCSNKRDWRKKRETEPNKLGDGYRRTPIKKTTTTAWPAPLNKEDSTSLKEEEKIKQEGKTPLSNSQRKYTHRQKFIWISFYI